MWPSCWFFGEPKKDLVIKRMFLAIFAFFHGLFKQDSIVVTPSVLVGFPLTQLHKPALPEETTRIERDDDTYALRSGFWCLISWEGDGVSLELCVGTEEVLEWLPKPETVMDVEEATDVVDDRTVTLYADNQACLTINEVRKEYNLTDHHRAMMQCCCDTSYSAQRADMERQCTRDYALIREMMCVQSERQAIEQILAQIPTTPCYSENIYRPQVPVPHYNVNCPY